MVVASPRVTFLLTLKWPALGRAVPARDHARALLLAQRRRREHGRVARGPSAHVVAEAIEEALAEAGGAQRVIRLSSVAPWPRGLFEQMLVSFWHDFQTITS